MSPKRNEHEKLLYMYVIVVVVVFAFGSVYPPWID